MELSYHQVRQTQAPQLLHLDRSWQYVAENTADNGRYLNWKYDFPLHLLDAPGRFTTFRPLLHVSPIESRL